MTTRLAFALSVVEAFDGSVSRYAALVARYLRRTSQLGRFLE